MKQQITETRFGIMQVVAQTEINASMILFVLGGVAVEVEATFIALASLIFGFICMTHALSFQSRGVWFSVYSKLGADRHWALSDLDDSQIDEMRENGYTYIDE